MSTTRAQFSNLFSKFLRGLGNHALREVQKAVRVKGLKIIKAAVYDILEETGALPEGTGRRTMTCARLESRPNSDTILQRIIDYYTGTAANNPKCFIKLSSSQRDTAVEAPSLKEFAEKDTIQNSKSRKLKNRTQEPEGAVAAEAAEAEGAEEGAAAEGKADAPDLLEEDAGETVDFDANVPSTVSARTKRRPYSNRLNIPRADRKGRPPRDRVSRMEPDQAGEAHDAAAAPSRPHSRETSNRVPGMAHPNRVPMASGDPKFKASPVGAPVQIEITPGGLPKGFNPRGSRQGTVPTGTLGGIPTDSVRPEDLAALQASSLAYSPERLDPRTPPQLEGYTNIRSDDLFQVFESDTDKSVIVAFRGTDFSRSDDVLRAIKIGTWGRSSFESDPAIDTALLRVETLLTGFGYNQSGHKVHFVGHSAGGAISYLAHDRFSSAFNTRAVGFDPPSQMVLNMGQDYLSAASGRVAYAQKNDLVSKALLDTKSKYYQPGALSLYPNEDFGVVKAHRLQTILDHEEARLSHMTQPGLALEADLQAEEDEAAQAAGAPARGPGGDARRQLEDDFPPGDLGPSTGPVGPVAGAGAGAAAGAPKVPSAGTDDPIYDGVPVAGKWTKRGDPAGLAVEEGGPGSDDGTGRSYGAGTLADVVRPQLRHCVAKRFHAFGRSFRSYLTEFVKSPRLAAWRAQAGGGGHRGFDLVLQAYGTILPITDTRFHLSLDAKEMDLLFVETVAIVDWMLRNPEAGNRPITRLAHLLETKLFPAPPGTPVSDMTDNQLLAQMVTRGAAVKVPANTPRDKALKATKMLLPTGMGAMSEPTGVAAHSSGSNARRAAPRKNELPVIKETYPGVVQPADDHDDFWLTLEAFPPVNGGDGAWRPRARPFNDSYGFMNFETSGSDQSSSGEGY